LYHLDHDFSECRDLAKEEPERLQAMIAQWWQEAEKHGVLPLDDRGAADLFKSSIRPGMPTSRKRFVFYPPISHVVSDACPSAARGWRTTVALEHPKSGGDGALVARGSINSGFVLYILQGRLHFDYNFFHQHTRASSIAMLQPGTHHIELQVSRKPDGGADVQLQVDSVPVASAQIPRLLFMVSSIGMDLGRSLSPVNTDYQAPFAYPGHISQVVFEVGDKTPVGEIKAQIRAETTRQ
jgi:arylsulfatase